MRSFFFLFLWLTVAAAQAQSFQWAVGGGGASGDYCNDLATDPSGNSIATGWFQGTATFGSFSLTSSGDYDIFLVKINAAGQVLWASKAGGPGTDIGYGVALDGNGSIYLAGTFEATASFGPSLQLTSNSGSPDILVARYDTSGNPVWVHAAGSPTDDQAQGIAVHEPSASVFLIGYFKQTAQFGSLAVTSAGNSDVFIARYDTNSVSGTPAWLHTGGGTGYDNAYGACTDANGNVYVTGDFSGQASFGSLAATSAGDDDVFVAKYKASGSISWLKGCGGAGLDRGLGLTYYGGKVYGTGWFNGTASFGSNLLTGPGLDDIFVAAFDTANAAVPWAVMAGGAGYDQGYGICAAPSGVIVTGSFDGTAQIGSVTLTSQGSWDVFVSGYDHAGVFQWAVAGGGPAGNPFDRDIGYAVQADTQQDVYVAGIIRNTAQFGSYSVTSAGLQDAFVAKLSLQTYVSETGAPIGLQFYPNPASDFVTVSWNGKAAATVVFLDATGREVKTCRSQNGQPAVLVDLAGLARGLYLISVLSGPEMITGKLVRW